MGQVSDSPVPAAFLEQYYRDVDPDDLAGRSPEELRSTAATHRAMAMVRTPGRALVAVAEHARPTACVQVVTDDMPFLVDSLSAELTRQGFGINLVVHPQLVVRRQLTGELLDVTSAVDDRIPAGRQADGSAIVESWIHAEIDPVPGPDRRIELQEGLLRVLADVRESVEDWPKMCQAALMLADELEQSPPPNTSTDPKEAAALLRWLTDDHFTFLGYREYQLVDGDDGAEALRTQPGTGLGILRSDRAGSVSFATLPPEVRAHVREPRVLIITKANSRATVHRPSYLDYIGVKAFDHDGRVIGERRFLGLWSHSAYAASVLEIPVVRRTVAEVKAASRLRADSYSGKDLLDVLETYPREELFQIDSDQLLPIARGVLHLQERRRVRLFTRVDLYGRFVSCLVYLPRDRYTTRVRERMQQLLLEVYSGVSIDYTARVSDSALARVLFVVRVPTGSTVPSVDLADLQTRLVAVTRSFDDDVADAVTAKFGTAAQPIIARYAGAFPESYKEAFTPEDALHDICRLESLRGPEDLAMHLFQPPGAESGERRFKVCHVGAPMSLSLSSVLPLLQRMGVDVVDERPFQIDRVGAERAWIYDFGLVGETTQDVAYSRIAMLFQDAFATMWRGDAESDGFNALVLRAGLSWRQAMVLRTYCRYLRQLQTTFSQDYIARTVTSNPRIAVLLVRLFESRFELGVADREERCARLTEQITEALDALVSLDEDRILRSYLALVNATLRTNYYQADESGRPKSYLSIKLAPQQIADMPAPRPTFEVFVYSPRTEAVHLRFGPIARGGLRWSDRLEDFRTEVLGLVKAQTVKNVVIVPVGAKGGFVVKRPPAQRADLAAEVLACYRQFNCGMLDITDNLVDGKVVPPPNVVRHDGDDPYLVVAADKGTATFSDVANGIAKEYQFWLGDAYASGGSVGYDHKAMGITARGAWESVKHHFRTLGIDCQHEDFTCVGIGDMSGDVFGNGMLLSRHIRLIAAFDHRHVFIDPDPDPAVSFVERQRLFELPASSWADYDAALISPGGGVYPRSAKSVAITPQMRAAFGLEDDVTRLAPTELIRAVLRAPVQLLWNGGIGTYVRASTETDLDVGDKSNDTVRVSAAQLRCKVVGEGGNVGLTQLGRVEFALAGGLINTDAIDNSAGVDTSDHEVNIKVLLDRSVRDGELAETERNELLAAMTDEVAALVLRDNYEQNVALAAASAQADSMLHVHRRYIGVLEADGVLDRGLEKLPDDAVLAERHAAGLGLTVPEFAVLLAYSKIVLTRQLLDSPLPEEPYLRDELHGYFPQQLRDRFAAGIDEHPLRRELVVTRLVNQVVNFSGMTFAFRVSEETAASAPETFSAFMVVRELFGVTALWAEVEKLENVVDAASLTGVLLEIRKLTERATRWVLHNRSVPIDVSALIAEFESGVDAILPILPELLSGSDLAGFDARREEMISHGVPAGLASRVANAVPAFSVLDMVEIVARSGAAPPDIAAMYFYLGERLGIASLRDRVTQLPRDDRWHTMARNALRDDVYASHAALCEQVLACGGRGATPEQRFDEWAERNHSASARARLTLTEIANVDGADLGTLSIAVRTLRTLAAAGSRIVDRAATA